MKFAKMAMTLQVYFKLQGEVEKLYRFPGQKVTLNIARIFTAHFGNAKLADEQIDECVSAMAYWPDPNEPNFDPDESTDRFSRKRPAMWKLMPSILDEENLKVDPDPEPRNPAERVVWETVRAYDMATKSFGAQYVKWFASEYIYILFNGKEDFAMRYFRAFLARRESEYVGKPKRPVTEAFEMCDNVHMFAKGYLAVMEKSRLPKTHTTPSTSASWTTLASSGCCSALLHRVLAGALSSLLMKQKSSLALTRRTSSVTSGTSSTV